MSTSHKLLLAIVVVLVGLVSLGGWLWLKGQTSKPSIPTQTDMSAVETLPSADVQRFEAALNNQKREEQAGVMTPELSSVYLAQAQPMLPLGAHVRIMADSFTSQGTYGQVTASITADDRVTNTVLHLSRQDQASEWLVFRTEKR